MSGKSDQNHTSIKHLISDDSKSADAFDMASWGHPESEPLPAPKENTDHIEMHEVSEHEPESEASGYIEERPEAVDVSLDLQELGVQQTHHPIQYPKHSTVKVPLSDEKIMQGKEMPIDASFRWLAEVCLFLLHKAHIRLKVAHGKAVRIFENEKAPEAK